MRYALFSLAIMLCFGNSTQAPSQQVSNPGLKIELHTNATHLRSSDKVTLTVILRSPRQSTNLWNAFGWGPTAGFRLYVLDPSGNEVQNNFAQLYHAMPLDPKGREELISIQANIFAGFDEDDTVAELFPKPGKYVLKCIYTAPLPRHFFKGVTIWGREDGTIESNEVTIFVDK